MSPHELKKFVQQWLTNEQILGEETLELVMSKNESLNSKSSSAPLSDKRNVAEEVCPRQEGREHKLVELKELALRCNKCDLHKMRKNLVFGDGNPDSTLVFIGEAPGREEDEQGVPFVGEAGKLLTILLKSVGINRIDIYITNIIKCRPPGNRQPLPEEIISCYGWLKVQLELLAPKIICTLGRYATYSLVGRTHFLVAPTKFSEVRGKIYDYKGTKVVPTYHPAALLYHPKWKVDTISDLELVKELWEGRDFKLNASTGGSTSNG